MAALAGIDDYKARYGEPADSARTDVLLQDASDLMLAAYEDRLGAYSVGACPAFDRAAPAVCCLLVNRVLSAPSAMAGATQYSQGAGGYLRLGARRDVPRQERPQAPRPHGAGAGSAHAP